MGASNVHIRDAQNPLGNGREIGGFVGKFIDFRHDSACIQNRRVLCSATAAIAPILVFFLPRELTATS
jgi:hypothetical protein